MRRNRLWKLLGIAMAVLLCLLPLSGRAQDAFPLCPHPDRHSTPVYASRAMRTLMRFVSVNSPMPSSFRETEANAIDDPSGSLLPFWDKLSVLDRPLRIVHIGDSHVRGHVFPYVVRRLLEDDFGGKAVEQLPVTYQTSGLARETGMEGIVYHILGINGATCGSFSVPERLEEIARLCPDLIILSFGTNEAHARRYSAAEHTSAMEALLLSLEKGCPEAVFLLTTPPGAYVRNGRKGKIINPRTPQVVETELRFAREHGLAVWNLYGIAGGKRRACLNWVGANMFQRDRIHFTHEGYTLQGLLLHEAIIKAYNDYVATGLD